ncbi:hypothetical protein ACFQY4_36965 [Catellatospora bangladeshensis]|uniref:Uncharacterized protein n=1 Tax=Catellatospora bangladeshensis TaxID=310355 RepID=A0A8J3NL46_9ACTN|nr:hypothetical protein [Catellatospora bangladeshensis]GIF83411.1 hypothetical protein Cba03nite_47600 [Catellatospora bangladeshensis]
MTTPAEPAQPARPAPPPQHPADSLGFLAWAIALGILGFFMAMGARRSPWTVLSVVLLGVSLICFGGHVAAVVAKRHELWREGRGR